jgi:hypothetical protein
LFGNQTKARKEVVSQQGKCPIRVKGMVVILYVSPRRVRVLMAR